MKTTLEFDDTELSLLLGILTDKLESLRDEVQHTDARAYKKGLNIDRATLQTLVDKIRSEKAKAA